MDSFLDALRPLKAAQKSDPGSRSNALSGGSGSGPGSRSNAPSGGSGGNDRHDSAPPSTVLALEFVTFVPLPAPD